MEFLNYSFVTDAIFIGILTAVSAAMLGNFMVVARQAAMSHMLSHAAIAGVGLGVFWNITPIGGAFLTSLFATMLLWWLSHKKQYAPEAISVILLNGSLALALLLVHIDTDNTVSLKSYLFGSILTMNTTEFYLFIILNTIIIAVLCLFWANFLTSVFDKDFSHSRHKKNTVFEIVMMLLIAALVGIGLKFVGGLLIGAMLIIPPLTVQHFCHSFKSNVIMSILSNIVAVCCGIIISFYVDIPTSSGIVLTLIVFFGLSKFSLLFRS